MKKIKLKVAFPIPTIDDIQLAEAKIKSKFPSAFIIFLLNGNAGCPAVECCYIATEGRVPGGDICVQFLFPVVSNDPKYRTLVEMAAIYRNRFPEKYLAIGSDDFGNLLLIDISNSDGAISFWDHETEGSAGRSGKNVYKLAPSLAELIGQLGPEPEI